MVGEILEMSMGDEWKQLEKHLGVEVRNFRREGADSLMNFCLSFQTSRDSSLLQWLEALNIVISY